RRRSGRLLAALPGIWESAPGSRGKTRESAVATVSREREDAQTTRQDTETTVGRRTIARSRRLGSLGKTLGPVGARLASARGTRCGILVRRRPRASLFADTYGPPARGRLLCAR